MTNKAQRIILFGGLVLCLICGGLIWNSYSNSKQTADTIVGSSLQYFELSKTRLVFDPKRKKGVVWRFQYSHPTILDANFDIYTSPFGALYITNPTDLYDRLRANEEMAVHPYAK